MLQDQVQPPVLALPLPAVRAARVFQSWVHCQTAATTQARIFLALDHIPFLQGPLQLDLVSTTHLADRGDVGEQLVDAASRKRPAAMDMTAFGPRLLRAPTPPGQQD